MESSKIVVDSPRTQYNERTKTLLSVVDYHSTRAKYAPSGQLVVTPVTETLTFRTKCPVPRVGCMLVGWAGNNGSTVTASVLANQKKLTWRTRNGVQVSSDYGSHVCARAGGCGSSA